MAQKIIKYSNAINSDFISVLRERVKEHFEHRGITRFADINMYVKTIIMLFAYLIPYFLILFGNIAESWIYMILWIVLGIASAGIGFSVMHDANHGSYSSDQKINNYLGYLLNFIGGSAVNWRIQHNYLHHSYTNIDGMDEDIDPGNVLRLSPHKPVLKVHRWQHIYAWFLYGLMTLSWITTKDFNQLKRYRDKGLLKRQNRSYRWLLNELFLSKSFFFMYLLVIPLIFSNIPWWQTLLFFGLMHYVQGFILTVIFQPAHVMPDTDYPLPDDTGNMENSWAVSQLLTTINFSPKSKIFSWYIGGLNFQIEHHLFPNICHIHYKKISEIVRKTAEEYNIPYNVEPTFITALASHGAMLKKLGRGNNPG